MAGNNNGQNMNTHAQRINQQPPDIVTYTNISVYLKGVRIGVIQRLERNETRDMAPIQELGTENVVQIVPGNTKGGQLTVERFALYANKFHQLLASSDGTNDNRGDVFTNLFQQRIPFEIQVQTMTPNGSPTSQTFVDCWISDYRASYNVGQITITESATIAYAFCV
jgi:hypothetical protein